MKPRRKIKKRHRVNTYKQACDNLLQAMKDVSDGTIVWEIRKRYLLLKTKAEVIENNIRLAEDDFFGKGD